MPDRAAPRLLTQKEYPFCAAGFEHTSRYFGAATSTVSRLAAVAK